jgi:hypothetical protein
MRKRKRKRMRKNLHLMEISKTRKSNFSLHIGRKH